ncbi:MAG: hypothetical protein MZV64_34295 [Ignavibacteriales bacterium]|nr:hypothetical protein [Ignavibacteriales bacterium]
MGDLLDLFKVLVGKRFPFQLVFSNEYWMVETGKHVFPLQKYRLVYENLLAMGAKKENFLRPRPAPDEDVLLVHSRPLPQARQGRQPERRPSSRPSRSATRPSSSASPCSRSAGRSWPPARPSNAGWPSTSAAASTTPSPTTARASASSTTSPWPPARSSRTGWPSGS